MPTTLTSRKVGPSRGVIGIFILAVVAWAGVLFWQLHRNPAQSHIDAGTEFARQGDAPNAIRELTLAAHIDPDNAVVWPLLARSCFAAQQWAPCRDALLQVLRLAPNTPHVYSLLASCSHNLGDADAVLRYAQEALKRDPNDAPAIEMATTVHIARGDDAAAISGMQRLAVLQPDNVDNLIGLIQLMMRQNDVTHMLPVLDRILKIQPDNAEMYALRGTSRFYSDGSVAGQKLCEQDMLRAMSIKPTIYAAPLYLGRIYRRRGQLERAKQYFARATRLKPNQPQAFFDLAGVEARLGETASAAADRRRFQALVSAAEQYTHLKKQCSVAASDFTLNLKVGELALKYGDFKWAIICLQRANRLRPTDARVATDLKRLDARRHQPGGASGPSEATFSADSETPADPATPTEGR